MLGVMMLNRVAGHVDGTDVVTIGKRGAAEGSVQLQQELTEPGNLGHSIG